MKINAQKSKNRAGGRRSGSGRPPRNRKIARCLALAKEAGAGNVEMTAALRKFEGKDPIPADVPTCESVHQVPARRFWKDGQLILDKQRRSGSMEMDALRKHMGPEKFNEFMEEFQGDYEQFFNSVAGSPLEDQLYFCAGRLMTRPEYEAHLEINKNLNRLR